MLNLSIVPYFPQNIGNFNCIDGLLPLAEL